MAGDVLLHGAVAGLRPAQSRVNLSCKATAKLRCAPGRIANSNVTAVGAGTRNALGTKAPPHSIAGMQKRG